MQIIVNGDRTQVSESATLQLLLEQLQLQCKVAIELNHEIVPRSDYPRRALAEGDRVEIVQAIGGG
jgi:sulfur carrier protein